MPPSARERGSGALLAAGYLLVGTCIRVGQALYVRSLPGYTGPDPVGVLVASAPASEKAMLLLTWWVIPILTWPFSALQMVFRLMTKH